MRTRRCAPRWTWSPRKSNDPLSAPLAPSSAWREPPLDAIVVSNALRSDERLDRRARHRGNSAGTEPFDIRAQPARNLRTTDNFVERDEPHLAVLSERRRATATTVGVCCRFRRVTVVARPLLSAER
jgi:hypothetical protein